MANTRFTQFLYSKHGKLCFLDVKVPIGATGAVGTLVGGAGIASVARNAAGIYQVNLLDSYSKFLSILCEIDSPNSGSDILVASAGTTSGTTYVITLVGTTTTAGWVTLGLPVGITPAVGVAFKSTATTTASGTGVVQVQAAAGSTISHIEVIGNGSTTVNVTGIGAANPYIIFQCLAATNSSTTTFVATDPASGSSLRLTLLLSDASNVSKNNG